MKNPGNASLKGKSSGAFRLSTAIARALALRAARATRDFLCRRALLPPMVMFMLRLALLLPRVPGPIDVLARALAHAAIEFGLR